MAHNLFLNSAMAFAGDVPWHGLGVKLPKNATWEEIKSVLPFYTVQERQLFAAGLEGAIPDRKALIADNDGRYLATVGADYGVVQFDTLAESVMTAIGSEAVFHTAGLLGDNGARGWLLGEIPNPIRVLNDPSEIRKFFLATTTHDGTGRIMLKNVATRVVCANTLGVALGEREGAAWGIRHTKNALDLVKAAAQSFASALRGMEAFGELANALARVRLSAEQTATVISATVPVTADMSDKQIDKVKAARLSIMTRADQGIGLTPAMRGSAWALFQGITEHADHVRPIRGFTGKVAPVDVRFDSQIFGTGAALKQTGLAALRSVAGV